MYVAPPQPKIIDTANGSAALLTTLGKRIGSSHEVGERVRYSQKKESENALCGHDA